MKDSRGHGSNGKGGSSVVVQNGSSSRGIMPARPFRQSQGPVTSNAEAADALASTLKATQAPVHDAMAVKAAAWEARGRTNSSADYAAGTAYHPPFKGW